MNENRFYHVFQCFKSLVLSSDGELYKGNLYRGNIEKVDFSDGSQGMAVGNFHTHPISPPNSYPTIGDLIKDLIPSNTLYVGIISYASNVLRLFKMSPEWHETAFMVKRTRRNPSAERNYMNPRH